MWLVDVPWWGSASQMGWGELAPIPEPTTQSLTPPESTQTSSRALQQSFHHEHRQLTALQGVNLAGRAPGSPEVWPVHVPRLRLMQRGAGPRADGVRGQCGSRTHTGTTFTLNFKAQRLPPDIGLTDHSPVVCIEHLPSAHRWC